MEPNNPSGPPIPPKDPSNSEPSQFIAAPVVTESQTQLKKHHSTGGILARIAAILLIIAGIVVGFGLGFMIAFGACFKSSCGPVEGGAPFWLPLASLLITVPLARVIFKKT